MDINIHENLKKIKLPERATNSSAMTIYIVVIFMISTVLAYAIGRQSSLEHTNNKDVNNEASIAKVNKINDGNADSTNEIKIIGLPQNEINNMSGSSSNNSDNTSMQDNTNINTSLGQSSNSDQDTLMNDTNPSSGTVFASPRGSKYYLPWCSGGKTLKDKIYFKTEQEAIEKGYTKSTTCK